MVRVEHALINQPTSFTTKSALQFQYGDLLVTPKALNLKTEEI
jgi:hypothetical protein